MWFPLKPICSSPQQKFKLFNSYFKQQSLQGFKEEGSSLPSIFKRSKRWGRNGEVGSYVRKPGPGQQSSMQCAAVRAPQHSPACEGARVARWALGVCPCVPERACACEGARAGVGRGAGPWTGFGALPARLPRGGEWVFVREWGSRGAGSGSWRAGPWPQMPFAAGLSLQSAPKRLLHPDLSAESAHVGVAAAPGCAREGELGRALCPAGRAGAPLFPARRRALGS